MFNDRSSLLSYLATRRSGRPRDLIAPGPDASELRKIIELGSRTPDHGKLHPWRFIHIPQEKRQAFSDLLRDAYLEERPSPGRLEVEANEKFALQAPELLVALFSPRPITKIPLWEQQLSCGAVCFNVLNAAGALGYAAGWVTGWAAYSDAVLRAFGTPEERIAGFMFIGTAAAPLEERPRPVLEDIFSEWPGA